MFQIKVFRRNEYIDKDYNEFSMPEVFVVEFPLFLTKDKIIILDSKEISCSKADIRENEIFFSLNQIMHFGYYNVPYVFFKEDLVKI